MGLSLPLDVRMAIAKGEIVAYASNVAYLQGITVSQLVTLLREMACQMEKK